MDQQQQQQQQGSPFQAGLGLLLQPWQQQLRQHTSALGSVLVTACHGPGALPPGTSWLGTAWAWLKYVLLSYCPQHLLVAAVHLLFLAAVLALSITKLVSSPSSSRSKPPPDSTDANGTANNKHHHRKHLAVRTSTVYTTTVTASAIVGLVHLALAVWRTWLAASSAPAARIPLFQELLFSWSQAAAWLAFAALVGHEKAARAVRHAALLRWWWAATLVVAGLGLWTAVARFVGGAEHVTQVWVDNAVAVATFPVAAYLAVVACVGVTGVQVVEDGDESLREPLLLDVEGSRAAAVEQVLEERQEEEEEGEVTWFASAGAWGKLTWAWVNPLLARGKARPLELKDVPALAPDDRADRLYARLRAGFTPDPTPPGPQGQQQGGDGSTNRPQPRSVGAALARTFWPSLAFTGLLCLLKLSVMYVGPLLITQFVAYASGERRFPYEGPVLVLVLFGAKLIEVLSSHHYNFWSQKLGMTVRSALITCVYRKGLRLSSAARQAHGVGQIVNYMSVDVQQISDSVVQLHNVWLLPLQTAAALVILYTVIGAACFGGIAVMVAILAVSFALARLQRVYQGQIMSAKDARVSVTAEAVNGMKIIKLQAWEEEFQRRIEEVRDGERGWLAKFMYALSVNIFFLWLSPLAVSTATFALCVALGTELTSARVFTALSTFRIMQEPLRLFPQALMSISQALNSVDRLERYMTSAELDPAAVRRLDAVDTTSSAADGTPPPPAIAVQDGVFQYLPDADRPTLSGITLSIPPGSLVAVVGQVGSGKSALLLSLLGEVPKLSPGPVTLRGRTAYVAQSPWIQNATVRDNILFGSPYDANRYAQTLRVCALDTDLRGMDAGDATEIGERGINLSGGQKQRVQLARAVYADADLFFLDDVFSAVDAATGGELFRECVRGALRGKTVVLVTHQVEFLGEADLILVMRDGRIVQSGKYDELAGGGTDFGALVAAHKEAMDAVTEKEGAGSGGRDGSSSDEEDERAVGVDETADTAMEELFRQPPMMGESPAGIGLGGAYGRSVSGRWRSLSSRRSLSLERNKSSSGRGGDRGQVVGSVGGRRKQQLTKADSKSASGRRPKDSGAGAPAPSKLIADEERATGQVGFHVYYLYGTKALHGLHVIALLIFQTCWQALQIASDYFLADQTSAANASAFNPTHFITRYAELAFGSGLFVLLRSVTVAFAGLLTAQCFFVSILAAVLAAPMSFFDTTPSGRILTRFTTDQTNIDILIPLLAGTVLGQGFQALGILVVVCQVTRELLLLVLPVGWAYFWYQRHFITTSRELTRLDALTKAPVINHFAETVAGFTTVRAFRAQPRFARANVERVDSNLRMDFHNNAATEWLGSRLELLGTLVLSGSALLMVTVGLGLVDADKVGLSLSYGLALNACMYGVVYMACQLENKMVSVERVHQYCQIPSEAPRIIPDHRPPPSWPSHGTIILSKLHLRYRPDTPLVLKGIDLTIPGGHKVGVVGRTGSGKSTLILAIFRLVEPASGRVLIDDLDISTIGLADLRSKFSIIPQDPTLFQGTVRSNLDPLGIHSDPDIWSALEKCQLAPLVKQSDAKLDAEVLENGENWSVGQRQLFCLGRAILKRSRILVLDEATASVDSHTDAVIQKTIKREFADCTVVSIAHRIPTVMDSDKVLVLDAGQVKEYDSPGRLLDNHHSLFSSLVHEYTARSG